MQFLNSRKIEKTYLLGAWASKGEFKDKDTGKSKEYDSTKVRLMQKDRVGGSSHALGYQDHVWGDSTNFEKIKHRDPCLVGPVLVEIEYESETKTIKTADGRSVDVELKNIFELRLIDLVDSLHPPKAGLKAA
jgi:hypothetical protein